MSASAATATADETFTYEAEVDRLMDMIVHSLYSNADVFLRELVSNASDALDKARFNAITDGADAGALRIRVKGDPDARTITIEDTGCGMTRDELVSSLGTIARSGTAKFAAAVKEAGGDASLIGQFGVGFYSAFLVADRVTVTTRSSGDDAGGWQWESAAGSHSYSIRPAPADFDLPRGTRVTLHLKEESADVAAPTKLAELIERYSEFVAFPVELWSSRTEYDQVVDAAATEKAQAAADAKAKEEGKEKADLVAPVIVPTPRDVFEWRVQNAVAPIWTRPPKEVTQDEYNAFFKQTFKEFMDPAAHAHFSVEGTVEFTALLYLPSMPPFEQADWLKPARNVRLFVKRVFISDEFDEDLVPRWASFVRGVVDSSDLPLNVSREILQESRVVRTIRRQLTKRTLDLLTEVASRPQGDDKPMSDYAMFYEGFGKYLKLGAIEDDASRKALAPLLRFPSSNAAPATPTGDAAVDLETPPPALTGLDDYVSRMKEGQSGIFYIASDSAASAAAAPHVEGLLARGYEVLYLVDPIDEPAINAIAEHKGHPFVDVTREGVDAGADDAEKAAAAAAAEELKPLLDCIKARLGARVARVEVSTRLAGSPVALATSRLGWSAHQERVMRSQALGDARAAEYMRGTRTLEVNAGHEVVKALADAVARGDTETAASAVELLYDAALVTGGFAVESPRDFAGRIYSMIGAAVAKK